MGALVDLHLHTTASDGRLSPTELVQLVADKGLQQVSISDHDSTEGLAEAFLAAQQFTDLRIIPGIELSTDIPGDEIHMLGYFIQYEDEEFQLSLEEFRRGRVDRAREMVERLAIFGRTAGVGTVSRKLQEMVPWGVPILL